jgi:hypothetical protein
MRNHNVIVQSNEEFEQNNFLPTPLSKKDDDNPYYLPTTQDGRTIYSCKSNFDHQQLQKKKKLNVLHLKTFIAFLFTLASVTQVESLVHICMLEQRLC